MMKPAALSCLLFLLFLSYLPSNQQDICQSDWDNNLGVAKTPEADFQSCSLASKQQDVYNYLWNNNLDIANETLQVDFLRQMQSGSLQAERYVNFTLQDINYLLKVTEMLKEMSLKVKDPKDLSDFMKGRYNSYKSFAETFLSQYFFKAAPPITPTPAMKKYLSDYRMVMNSDPIYFAVALLPCSRLWIWLANNLDESKTNAYYTWKVGNMEGHPEKHYKVLLNKYLNTTDKVKKANGIFRMQMQNERDFFASS